MSSARKSKTEHIDAFRSALEKDLEKSNPPARVVILQRELEPPLKFVGTLVARTPKGARYHDNWSNGTPWKWEIELYRMDSGKFVVAIIYKTLNGLEHNCHHAFVCETSRDVTTCFSGFDPHHKIAHFFDPKRFHPQDARTLAEKADVVRRMWGYTLTEFLARLDPNLLAEEVA